MLKGILSFAHHLLKETIKPGDLTVDATCGNGHDTLLLSQLTGDEGKVLSFDIQKQAINNTAELLVKHERTNVTLIHDSHEKISSYLNEHDEISGAIFNLGYLPGSDKSIVTKGSSTISALLNIFEYLKTNGLVVLVVYHGHPGGKDEKDSLLSFVAGLDQRKYSVLQYKFINQKNSPPFIIAIQKL